MPDTTDAVECYGTTVYRLAYAMTRSRTTRTTFSRRSFFAITVPPQPLPVKSTGGHGYCG